MLVCVHFQENGWKWAIAMMNLLQRSHDAINSRDVVNAPRNELRLVEICSSFSNLMMVRRRSLDLIIFLSKIVFFLFCNWGPHYNQQNPRSIINQILGKCWSNLQHLMSGISKYYFVARIRKWQKLRLGKISFILVGNSHHIH